MRAQCAAEPAVTDNEQLRQSSYKVGAGGQGQEREEETTSRLGAAVTRVFVWAQSECVLLCVCVVGGGG